LSKQNRVFGQELSNIPNSRNPQASQQNQKGYGIRRSVTLEVNKEKNNIDSKKGGLFERQKTNNFINGDDDNLVLKDNGLFNLDKSNLNNAFDLDQISLNENCDYDNFDIKNYKNPQLVCHVAKQIFAYLKENETEYLPKANYMGTQEDINEKMRAILVDWLVDVNVKFKLVPECLFMTWNIIDRYLTLKKVTRHKLQLVGVSALLIACKYEEIYPPALKEFVAICDKAYTSVEILEMEADVLNVLDFKLTHTSPLRFLERYSLIGDIESKAQMFAKYLIETTMLEYSMLKYKNSLLAAGAVFLVNKIFKKHGWTKVLEHHTGYSEADVKPCAKDLYFTMQNSEKLVLHAVKRKFSSPKYMEVSKYRIEKVPSSQNRNA